MEAVIRAVDLTKTYRLYKRPIDRFLELILPRARHTVFPALQEVSFEIVKGETIGLVGQNGAGKSTLLKLLCGVTQPSSGELHTAGTIASILELGTGFHPEFTGRDNAALNAAILGLSPGEVRAKLPSILEFSELGSFLDQPVKTYSSGMYMRLAFSVAVNVDPDILVIDEALAVGDGHFQKKCVDKIREFQQQGRTILFCSHALYFITTLCSRTIWLDRGTMRGIGPSVDVVHEYETFLMEQDRVIKAAEDEEHPPEAVAVSPVRITAAVVENRFGEQSTSFSTGDDIQLHVWIESAMPSQPIHLMVGVLRAADEMQCFAVGTHQDGLPPISGRRHYEMVIRLEKVPLLRGDYAIVVFAGDDAAIHVFDRKDIRPAFSIEGDRFEVGLIGVKHRWEEISSPAVARVR
ncbi:MAG: ABC transporter ATP-binding protein [Acidobacteriota bacterium]